MITDHIQTKLSFQSFVGCRLPRISSICGLLLTAILSLKREVSAASGAWLWVAAYFRQQQPLLVFSSSSIGQLLH
jgi:hypothetical protein